MPVAVAVNLHLGTTDIMSVPGPIVHYMGVKPGKNMKFCPINGKVFLMPSDKDLTKKDLTDIDMYERAFDEAMKDDRQESKDKPVMYTKMSAREKFRIK